MNLMTAGRVPGMWPCESLELHDKDTFPCRNHPGEEGLGVGCSTTCGSAIDPAQTLAVYFVFLTPLSFSQSRPLNQSASGPLAVPGGTRRKEVVGVAEPWGLLPGRGCGCRAGLQAEGPRGVSGVSGGLSLYSFVGEMLQSHLLRV